MKVLKGILAFALLLCVIFAVFGCNGATDETAPPPPEKTDAPAEEDLTKETDCKHEYELEGIMKYTCAKCGETKTEVPKSLKILAIGNSFSVDAMEYLWQILDDVGVEDITLGNLYIGGCSLNTHYSNAKADSGSYTYYKNTAGTWTSREGHKISTALAEEEWDIVTLQQASNDSGMKDTYSNLDKLVEYVVNAVPSACKLYWHMTWAYQQNTSHDGFANYSRDQMQMYNAITEAVKAVPMKNKYIEGLIPCGTTVQNLRSSYVGDTLTRDGYHMSLGLGRYITGLTWLAALGGDVDEIEWMPEKSYTSDMPAIREAVKNAVAKPLEVTKSSYTQAPDRELVELESIFEDLGKEMSDYTELALEEVLNSYYNSTDSGYKSTRFSSANSSAGNLHQFNSTAIFEKSDIPEGSIIIIESGYQYRPEGWKSLNTVNAGGERPSNVILSVVTVTNAWWGSFNYRAFNISKQSGETMTYKDMGRLHIFVPN